MLKSLMLQLIQKGSSVLLILYCDGILARSLEVHEYGLWQFSISIAMLLFSAGLIFPAEIIIPALSRNKRLHNKIVSATLLFRVTSLIIPLLLFSIVYFFNIMEKESYFYKYLLLMILVVSTKEIVSVATSLCFVRFDLLLNTVLNITATIVKAVLFSYAIFNDVTIDYFVYCLILEAVIICFFTKIILRRQNFKFCLKPAVNKILFFRGLKIWLSVFIIYIYSRLDKYFIEKEFGLISLAYYSIAIQIIVQLQTVLLMFVRTICARFVFCLKDKRLAREKIVVISLSSLVLSILLMFMVIWLAPLFVNFVYGSRYNVSIEYFKIMVLGLPFVLSEMILFQWFIYIKANKVLFYKGVILLCSSCLLYMFYLPDKSQIYASYLYVVLVAMSFSYSLLVFVFSQKKEKYARLH